MNITYIHHSGFLVETRRFYYLFDYETGALPQLDTQKPMFVLSSHGHEDHYEPEIFHNSDYVPFLLHDLHNRYDGFHPQYGY